MSNLQVQKQNNVIITTEGLKLGFDDVKGHIQGTNPNIKDKEVETFFKLCVANSLNPFSNEAYIVKYSNTASAQYIVDYKAYERGADLNPDFDGLESGVVVEDAEGKQELVEGTIVPKGKTLVGAWCNVYNKKRSKPTKKRVSLKEFNKGQSTWKDRPAFMIEKVAKTHGYREAFPNALKGFHTSEEMVVSGVNIEQEELNQKNGTEYVDVASKYDKNTGVILEEKVLLNDEEKSELFNICKGLDKKVILEVIGKFGYKSSKEIEAKHLDEIRDALIEKSFEIEEK